MDGAGLLFCEGTVALVTGASKGIGAACAIDLAREGAHVVVNYNSDAEGADQTVELIRGEGGSAEAVQADVSSEAAVLRMMAGIRSKHRRLDVLVANAGVTADRLAMVMTVADFEKVLSTNVIGTFLVCREAAKIMVRDGRGSIVTMSSITQRGYPAVANYSASKAAISSFSKSLATELAARGIRVNSVSPGLIETAMGRSMSTSGREQVVARTALNRTGTPQEVAALVSFLASDKASYITGTDIPVDGGSGLGLTVTHTVDLKRDTSRRRMAGSKAKALNGKPAPAQAGQTSSS
jgi:3-oxoacyl-[acyl-carrier protein] reductase